MTSEMGKLMENIQEGQTCPADNCGGKIEEVDYLKIGRGKFLQCTKNPIIHYRRILPPNPKTAVVFKTFRPE